MPRSWQAEATPSDAAGTRVSLVVSLESAADFRLGFAAGFAVALVPIAILSALRRRACGRRRSGTAQSTPRLALKENVVALATPRGGAADEEAQEALEAEEGDADINGQTGFVRQWSSEDEMAKVRQLRRLTQQANAASGLPVHTRWYEDGDLLRFVRARKTFADSERLFCEAMRWRREYSELWGVDTSQTGSFGPEQAAFKSGALPAPDWWKFLRDHLSMNLYGSDCNGLPILYNGLGRDDLQGCMREVGLERLQHYAVMLNDSFLDAARAATASRGPSREVLLAGYVILDMDGLSLRHLGEAKVFNEISAVIKILHPERMQRCFVIRAPRIFAAVWRLCRSVVDPRTVSKITIIGHGESLDPLIAELGAENVPDFLGGKNATLIRPSTELVRLGAFAKYAGGTPNK